MFPAHKHNQCAAVVMEPEGLPAMDYWGQMGQPLGVNSTRLQCTGHIHAAIQCGDDLLSFLEKGARAGARQVQFPPPIGLVLITDIIAVVNHGLEGLQRGVDGIRDRLYDMEDRIDHLKDKLPAEKKPESATANQTSHFVKRFNIKRQDKSKETAKNARSERLRSRIDQLKKRYARCSKAGPSK